MRESFNFPLEIEDLILEALADSSHDYFGGHILGDDLGNCALVSRRWLYQSRRQLFLQSWICFLSEPKKVKVPDWEQLLHHHLCSVWPHVRNILINDKRSSIPLPDDKPPRILDSAVSFLSYAVNLTQICISRLYFHNHLPDIVSHPSFQRISSLRLHEDRFASPAQFLDFLDTLGQPLREINISNICFAENTWDSTSYSTPSTTHPPEWILEFSDPENFLSFRQLIFNHQWNISMLYLTDKVCSQDNIPTINDILRHIGPHLKMLTFTLHKECAHNEPLLSLSRNTSLQELSFKSMGTISGDNVTPFVWLTALLATVTSKEQFVSLAGGISIDWDGNDPDGWRAIEHFNWKSLEDVLTDSKIFPGKGADLMLLLDSGLACDEVSEFIFPEMFTSIGPPGSRSHWLDATGARPR